MNYRVRSLSIWARAKAIERHYQGMVHLPFGNILSQIKSSFSSVEQLWPSSAPLLDLKGKAKHARSKDKQLFLRGATMAL